MEKRGFVEYAYRGDYFVPQPASVLSGQIVGKTLRRAGRKQNRNYVIDLQNHMFDDSFAVVVQPTSQ
jgi:hypothetical protein